MFVSNSMTYTSMNKPIQLLFMITQSSITVRYNPATHVFILLLNKLPAKGIDTGKTILKQYSD